MEGPRSEKAPEALNRPAENQPISGSDKVRRAPSQPNMGCLSPTFFVRGRVRPEPLPAVVMTVAGSRTFTQLGTLDGAGDGRLSLYVQRQVE
jgi:hypothetical protein